MFARSHGAIKPECRIKGASKDLFWTQGCLDGHAHLIIHIFQNHT